MDQWLKRSTLVYTFFESLNPSIWLKRATSIMIAADHMRDRGPAPRVVARSDVVVVGGGPTGFAAAIAAARLGVKVTLVERYPYRSEERRVGKEGRSRWSPYH